MNDRYARWILVMQVVLILAMGIDILLAIRAGGGCASTQTAKPPLPCAAIPMSFVAQFPECADHLIQAMNITNVRVQRWNESTAELLNPWPNISIRRRVLPGDRLSNP